MLLKSKVSAIAAVMLLTLSAISFWQLTASQPAPSKLYQEWLATAPSQSHRGAALFAFGDFGALDLDTLETSAVPWNILAASLALRESGGQEDRIEMSQVVTALKRFGFLFPKSILKHPDLKLSTEVPLGVSIGVVERRLPPLRITAMNIGCAACHAGPAYRSDGSPDPDIAVLGRPNTGLDLEAFTTESYQALKQAFSDEPRLTRAMDRLFPAMTWREKLTLSWIVFPKVRNRLADLVRTFDKPLPFNNGAPGLTNGVAALKYQLGVTRRDRFMDGAGFVSIPDLADRNFRSALLADGAYAPKGGVRFQPVVKSEAAARDPKTIASIASFFMVPTMGLTSQRAAQAIPGLTDVISYIAKMEAPKFPGKLDNARAAQGKDVYIRACASCHGAYNDSLSSPALASFPNWSGDVGTDRSRVEAFDQDLMAAVNKTPHGQQHLDAAATGVAAAPLLSGLWASAPYFTNGSVPTLKHLLEPDTRPVRFMTGGHRLDLERVGIEGVPSSNGIWQYPADYAPNSKPVMIDTTKPGFANRGHEKEVTGLTADERTNLIEYLKLL